MFSVHFSTAAYVLRAGIKAVNAISAARNTLKSFFGLSFNIFCILFLLFLGIKKAPMFESVLRLLYGFLSAVHYIQKITAVTSAFDFAVHIYRVITACLAVIVLAVYPFPDLVKQFLFRSVHA